MKGAIKKLVTFSFGVVCAVWLVGIFTAVMMSVVLASLYAVIWLLQFGFEWASGNELLMTLFQAVLVMGAFFFFFLLIALIL